MYGRNIKLNIGKIYYVVLNAIFELYSSMLLSVLWLPVLENSCTVFEAIYSYLPNFLTPISLFSKKKSQMDYYLLPNLLFIVCYRNSQYENFHVDQKGYDQMYDGEDLETPPSPDRPPPRKIGNYHGHNYKSSN